MFRTGVVAFVLLLALSAQAQTLPPDADSLLEDVTGSEPGADPAPHEPPTPEAPDVGQTFAMLRGELRGALHQVRGMADPEKLERQVVDAFDPARATLEDAQREIDGLLQDEEEPAPDTQPQMKPQAQASAAAAWPELAPPVLLFAGTAAGLGILVWLLGQSATVGAGAAGLAARDGRRFLPLASPLFTRFEKDTVLGHPKREAIYGHIISTPGITLQDLCKESGLSRTAVTHHLRLLEQQHLVVSKRVGRSRHFFENGGRYGRHQKDAYAVLHNDRTKEIHDFIRKQPGSIQKDLCEVFAIQASVAHWHVKRLLDAGLVEAVRQGRTVSYFPAAQVAAPAPLPVAAPA